MIRPASDPRRRRVIDLRLVTEAGEATPEFVREWRAAGARSILPAGLVLVDGKGLPTPDFLSLWQGAWGGSTLRALNFATVVFGPDGRFTPLGYARWLVAIAP